MKNDDPMKNTLNYQMNVLKEAINNCIFEFAKSIGIIWILEKLTEVLTKLKEMKNGKK